MSKQQGKAKIIVLVFLAAGIFSTFAYKLQGSQLVTESTHTHKHFFHPYCQSMTLFFAEFLCLIVFFMRGRGARLPLEQGKTPHNRLQFFIPACSDAMSSTLQYIGLAFISGSTYMMFKGATIITTAIFSRVLVKMVIEKRHIVGCGLAVIGLVIVGASGLLSSNESGETTFQQQFIGYILMLTSLIFSGFYYAYEQKLMRYHTIHPLELAGFQGLFGMCILTVLLTVLSFIPCSFGVKGCVYEEDGRAFMELPLVYAREVGESWLLLLLVVSGILSMSVYDFSGVTITKMFDALTRSLLSLAKTAGIWAIGIVVTIFATTPEYELEDLNLWVILVKGIGLSCIILGTLIYNRLVFRKYFQSKLKKDGVLVEEVGVDSVLTNEDIAKGNK